MGTDSCENASVEMIEALAELRIWGARDQANEQLRSKEFKKYLTESYQGMGQALGQAVMQACTPAGPPEASIQPAKTASTTTTE